jgi:hypothetical protein
MIIRNGSLIEEAQVNKAIIGIGVVTFLTVIMVVMAAKYEKRK